MRETTLQKALRHFGHNAQVLKCVEECSELSVTLLHHLDGKSTLNEMAGEVADVLIMANQMRLMLGPGLVDNWIQSKLARLEERMHG